MSSSRLFWSAPLDQNVQFLITVGTVIAVFVWLRADISALRSEVASLRESVSSMRESLAWMRGRLGYSEDLP